MRIYKWSWRSIEGGGAPPAPSHCRQQRRAFRRDTFDDPHCGGRFCVHVCVCVHIYMYINMCIYMMYMYICIHMYIFTGMFIHTHAQACTSNCVTRGAFVCLYKHTHTIICALIHPYTQACKSNRVTRGAVGRAAGVPHTHVRLPPRTPPRHVSHREFAGWR